MLSDPGVPGLLSWIVVLISLREEKQNWLHLQCERAVNVDCEPGSQGSSQVTSYIFFVISSGIEQKHLS